MSGATPRLIVLTGGSGVGKSTLALHLQAALQPEVWLHFSVDTLLNCYPAAQLERANRHNDWAGIEVKTLLRSAYACLHVLVAQGPDWHRPSSPRWRTRRRTAAPGRATAAASVWLAESAFGPAGRLAQRRLSPSEPAGMATLAQVLRLGADAYLREHALSTPQARAWRGICACRTALLGGQCLACAQCGHRHWQYHSCRNRHCPQCGARSRDAWLRGRLAEVLDVPYAHLVFTLPHEINSLYRCQPRWVIETLFASVAATLKDFAANPRWMGIESGQAAFSLVLHTWSQDLRQHLHLHAVMACGVLGHDNQWHAPARRPDFLFPVQALSKVYRGKFMAARRQWAQHSELEDANLTASGRRALVRHDWVVYAKTPLGGPAQVLEYLGRYTHRTAIGNERIQALTPERQVVFTVRADP